MGPSCQLAASPGRPVPSCLRAFAQGCLTRASACLTFRSQCQVRALLRLPDGEWALHLRSLLALLSESFYYRR